MKPPTDATVIAYERRADLYTAAAEAKPGPALVALFDGVLSRIPPRGHLLELGSGPGLDARYLEERGAVVDRTDAARAFVARLRDQGHRARVLDARDPDFGGPYDGVVANAVLLHLSRSAAGQALSACFEATRPGGVLAMTMKEGDGEGWSDAKLGLPRWFVYWREEALRGLLRQAGWDVVDVVRVQAPTQPWLHVLAERPILHSAPVGGVPEDATTARKGRSDTAPQASMR